MEFRTYKINIYANDTELWVASLKLNEVLSRTIRKTITEKWDNVGEYDLTEGFEKYKYPSVFWHLLSINSSLYTYTLEGDTLENE